MINTGSVVLNVETANAFGILVGNPDDKLPLGRPRRRRYGTINPLEHQFFLRKK